MRPLGSIDFSGTDRFQVLRRLGSGGMGVVYEAFDRERGAPVALKTLRTFSADALVRFKHEFRALQDIQHENLVSLGELFESHGHWFFTMELVDGVGFLDYVRPSTSGPRAVTGELDDDGDTMDLKSGPVPPTAPRLTLGALDEARLRAALGQLARGVHALHARRKVHRDLKPSNILVAPNGRVVVLDFGLIIDAGSDDGGGRSGTVMFMAPEQAARAPVGPEADWYAVGVILYIALTGRMPFDGSGDEVLVQKQISDPLPPSRLVPGIAADLEELCLGLLQRDPAARPRGRDVLARLRVTGADAAEHSAPLPFVGRAAELRALDEAFAAAERKGVSVYLHGESGIGKSTLARRFTDEVATRHDVVVLMGRCFERESVPYKAFDGIVDELSRFLGQLSREEVALVLPRKPWLLLQVFPQLGRVPIIDEARRPSGQLVPQELRSQAFAALRELFGRLADRHRLVLVIDDLQWADADSLALLAEVMRPPEEPALLLIATVRSDADQSKLDFAHGGDLRKVQLGGLSSDEARQFAALLLQPSEAGTRAAEIAREAGGHPLFINALAQSGRGASSLETALGDRVAQLEPRARTLLDIVAIAGTPLRQATAATAAQMSFAELADRVAVLRALHLVLTRGARSSDTVEVYHDRVRRAVLGAMTPEQSRAHHRRLAEALVRDGAETADLEAIAVHWHAAGEPVRAARFAVRAAEDATRTLAFDRAARLYRWALELDATDAGETRRIKRQLGDALANAGRGAEAARAYQEAAALSDADEAHELTRLAAEHLLFSGRFDEGLATLERALDAVGLKLPSTPRRALVSLLWHQLRVRLRHGRMRELSPGEIPPDRLRRIDTCHAAAVGLGLVDIIRGAEFNARQILLAQDGSDAFRLTRALAAEAAFASATGKRGFARTDALLRAAEEMAQRSTQPAAIGWAIGSIGFTAFQRGEWKRAAETMLRAEEILREQCTGMAWEHATVQSHLLFTLPFLGRFADSATLGRQWLRAARERGDLFATTMLRLALTTTYLAEDDAATARREADEALAGWTHSGFHLQHFHAMHARVRCALYTGDTAGALTLLEQDRVQLEASLLLRFQISRITAYGVRTQATLTAAARATGDERKRLVAEARASVKRIAREQMTWSDPLALLYRAGIVRLDGDDEGAGRLLEQAERGFVAADMVLHAAVARRQRGILRGGDEGARLARDGEAAIAACGVRNPARLAAHYAPALGAPGEANAVSATHDRGRQDDQAARR